MISESFIELKILSRKHNAPTHARFKGLHYINWPRYTPQPAIHGQRCTAFEKYRRMEIFRGAPRCSFGLKLSNDPDRGDPHQLLVELVPGI